MSNPAVDRARLLRRRREHSRQIVLFGILGTALAVVFTLALLIFGGVIDAPFDRGFSSPQRTAEELAAPCLPTVLGQPDGALPVPYDEIDLRIFNASGIAGVGSASETVLSRRGFDITTVANWVETVPINQMRFGTGGIVAAYTVAAHFPPMQMILDYRPDASVDLVVGENYDQPIAVSEVTLAADRPLLNVRGCLPVTSIRKEPIPPTWTPAPEPVEEETDA
ncbi:MAG: LytR C-terminal domain-containing protein [Promicromonosporaceae bacterium]|nr:LytR C-terminal domain-containing protein [Promicromonosporaceae bacterium]